MERYLLLLILLYITNIFGDETFWFSYRSVISNKVLIYEERNISPAMTKSNFQKEFTCKVKIDKNQNLNILENLNKNFYKILPCFYRVATKITASTENSLYSVNDKVEMIITPTQFIVEFKDDFANITLLK